VFNYVHKNYFPDYEFKRTTMVKVKTVLQLWRWTGGKL